MTLRPDEMLDAAHADSVVAAGADVSAPPPPPPPADGELSDPAEARLVAAVNEYTAALHAGRKVNRRALIARYSDVADELSACLAGLAFVESAAAQMSGDGATRTATVAPRRIEGVGTAEPLGDFQLLHEIGRGGMGVVYEAVQRSLGRRVAVKVLPMAAALDVRQLQRFRNEAQAAAQLHHGNIVPVYAVGCERSVHFYAMQLIEGQSLAEVFKELRASRAAAPPTTPTTTRGRGRWSSASLTVHLSAAPTVIDGSPAPSTLTAQPSPPPSTAPVSGPRPSMGLNAMRENPRRGSYYRAVAKLGLEVAEALEYAHRSGVVHRDVKPANILLDGQGKPWVTDFGLAQFYSDTELTRTGDMLGTLRYMSPEQASGRAVVLDQRTDIYSLGVTLYEMLALEPAYVATSHGELAEQIRLTDPKPLGAVDRAIPAELATILCKAYSKEPGDRYATAAAMADDLRRHLDDEPILARPPSRIKRAGRWVRRHRGVSAAAAVFVGLLGVGLVTTTAIVSAQAKETRIAYRAARQALEAEQHQRVQAEQSFGQARDVVNYMSRVAATDLAGATAAAPVRREMLGAALTYYQSFLAAHRDDPTVDRDLVVASDNVKGLLAELAASDALDRVQFRDNLLTHSAVYVELGLNKDGAGKVVDQLLRYRRDSGGWGTAKAPADPRTQNKQSADGEEQRLSTLLTPQQIARLEQIDRRVRVPASFDDPDVLAALDLSREQKDAVRALEATARAAGAVPKYTNARVAIWGPPGLPARESAGEEAKEKAIASLRTLLTPKQQAAWDRLIGRPFAPERPDGDRPPSGDGFDPFHGPFTPGGFGEPFGGGGFGNARNHGGRGVDSRPAGDDGDGRTPDHRLDRDRRSPPDGPPAPTFR